MSSRVEGCQSKKKEVTIKSEERKRKSLTVKVEKETSDGQS